MERDLPPIGLGTWQNTDSEQCVATVKSAIEMGYRHIDTAQYYGNESAVGKGVSKSDVPREDLTIATKVHAETSGLGYSEVIQGVQDSCDRLGLDYIDILYVHWPIKEYDPEETLAAFEELKSDGKISHIGLSNYTMELLEEALDFLSSSILAHQIEFHPFIDQSEYFKHAQAKDYFIIAYSPLARGNVFNHPTLQQIAQDNDVSEAVISLVWLLSKPNVRTIPKATSEDHLEDNITANDIDLTSEEIDRIDKISKSERYVERDDAPWLDNGQ